MTDYNARRKFAWSLKEIMRKKALSDVHVKEIVETAHLSRQSFYTHFKDKYDLARYVWEQEIHLLEEIYQDKKSLYGLTVAIMTIMENDRAFYRNLLKNIEEQNSFFSYWVHMSEHSLVSQLNDALCFNQFVNFIHSPAGSLDDCSV